MATEPVGYAYLIAREGLAALPLDQTAVIDTAVKGRTRVNRGDQVVLQFESKYRPAPTLRTHVQNTLMKLGVHSKLDAIVAAIRHERVVIVAIEDPDDLAGSEPMHGDEAD